MIKRASALLLGMIICVGWSAPAQDAQHLSTIVTGGIPCLPLITGITPATNEVIVTWDGPSGYYQLYEGTSLAHISQPVGSPYNLLRTQTTTNPPSPAFFRVAGTVSPFAGQDTCAECHQPVLDTVIHTAHANAYAILTNAQFAALGGPTNGFCLDCHTVGFGAPTGFQSLSATPQLAGVQCENCHGAAANHASNPGDASAIPRVEMAGTLCGGATTTSPTLFLRPRLFLPRWWACTRRSMRSGSSAHQPVVPDVATDFATTSSLISTCGRCHSGTVREAFLENYAVLPDAQEASAVGVACATCHDPHEEYRLYERAEWGRYLYEQLTGTASSPITSAEPFTPTNSAIPSPRHTITTRPALFATNTTRTSTSVPNAIMTGALL